LANLAFQSEVDFRNIGSRKALLSIGLEGMRWSGFPAHLD
jgi:hypothetical protein